MELYIYITTCIAILYQNVQGTHGSCCATAIQIKLVTDPLIIGGQAVFQCQTPMSETPITYYSWSKIRKDGAIDRLATTVHSSDISKYNTSTGNRDGNFTYSLIIENIQTVDFDFGLRCELDYAVEDIHISLDKYNVISVPSKKDVQFQFSLGKFHHLFGVFILPNVYPSISCKALRQGLLSAAPLNSSTRIQENYLKEVTFTVTSYLLKGDCRGSIRLVCMVSDFPFNTKSYSVRVCSDSENETDVPTEHIAISMSFVGVVVSFILIMQCKGKIRFFGMQKKSLGIPTMYESMRHLGRSVIYKKEKQRV